MNLAHCFILIMRKQSRNKYPAIIPHLGEGIANWLSYNTARYDKELKFTEATYVKTK